MTPAQSVGMIVALILALFVALAAFYFPWVDHNSAGFTMNGFDLAEWTSLHPAVRASSPPLLTAFLLRAPQVAIAIGLALVAGALSDSRWRAVGWGAALLIALRYIPPVEFLQSARSDPNYRQMALLTLLGVLGVCGAAGLSQFRDRWLVAGAALFVVGGAVAGWAGLSRAGVLLENFEIATSTGSGPLLYTGAALVMAILTVVRARLGRRRQETKKGD